MDNRSSHYYDVIYEAVGKDYAAEGQLLREIIQSHGLADGSSVLDVGCGTGGHLAHLTNFYHVEGLDIDTNMLELAKSKLPEAHFHEADMVDFSLGKSYDVVVSLFSSIGYSKTVDGLSRTISNMAAHVRYGGLVIAEPWFGPETYHAGVPHAVFVDKPELKISRMDVSQVDDDVSILEFHFLIANTGGVESFTERHVLGLFTEDQYRAAFEHSHMQTSYDRKGLTGRGLWLGVKSPD